jgi:multidrug resistance efflux pump
MVLSSQINGFVREVRVREGDLVAVGQLLAALDARDAESQMAAAQAGVEEASSSLSEARQGSQAAGQTHAAARAAAEVAEQTFKRYQKLFEGRSVSPQEMDEARGRRDAAAAELAAKESMFVAAQERIRQIEASISQAKARAARADVMMSWTLIKAPAAGRIVERSADPGTAIFPGSPLFVVESVARPQVVADVPTVQAGMLRPGMAVRVRGAGVQNELPARVAEIVPTSDASRHTTRFKVDLPADVALLSGQFVTVEIPAGMRNRLLAPRKAIRETGQITGLFVVDASSRARLRLVKLAEYDGELVELLAGVEPGESIIASSSDRIADGAPVEIRQ